MLFITILEHFDVPMQWEEMTLKSIYKNTGKITEMKNGRGVEQYIVKFLFCKSTTLLEGSQIFVRISMGES